MFTYLKQQTDYKSHEEKNTTRYIFFFGTSLQDIPNENI